MSTIVDVRRLEVKGEHSPTTKIIALAYILIVRYIKMHYTHFIIGV